MKLTRREALAGAALGAAASLPALPAAARSGGGSFHYSLNTSTLSGQRLPLPRLVELAARAGYDAIEPWIREIEEYTRGGGSLPELRARIRDAGLRVESAIGFPEWCVEDDTRRAKGLEDARRAMELVRQIGGTRLAAPPAGATNAPVEPLRLAERYRALLEIGDREGIVPQVEIWGFSRTLSRLGEAAAVAIESGHPRACILADVYHLYKGGSRPAGLRLLQGSALHVVHMNDYPADPPRERITDAQRVYPGDGVAPLREILQALREIGFAGYLSLELFNRDLWSQDPQVVARTGLEKMRAAVRRAQG